MIIGSCVFDPETVVAAYIAPIFAHYEIIGYELCLTTDSSHATIDHVERFRDYDLAPDALKTINALIEKRKSKVGFQE